MAKPALVLLTLGVVGAAAAAFLLFPSTAKAASGPLTGGSGPIDEGKPVNPQNADEAYSLGTNPQMTDPDYVHELAVWLNSYGQRPDQAAALEKRAQDLRAEHVLAEGLKTSTPLDQVESDARTLQPTHPDYAAVLGVRIGVQRGAAPPAPFMLPLQSGGSIRLDMSIYSSPAGGGLVPVGPSSGGTSSAASSVPPAAMPPASIPQPATTPLPSVSPPPVPTQSMTRATGTVTPAATPAPLAAVEVEPANDPNGTIALARAMIEEQSRPNWKYISAAVKAWQTKVGLTSDGKFGPGSALRMAQEVGILPWVRYWPLGGSGTKAGNVADFRNRLKAYAYSIAPKSDAYRTLAASLMVAADRETGQGWPTTTATPAPAQTLSTEQLEAAIRVLESELAKQR